MHAEQHFRPILAFRATGARVNGHDGAAGIVLTREKHSGFHLLEHCGAGFQFTGDVAVNVFPLPGQFEQGVQVGGQCSDAAVVGKAFFQPLSVLHDFLAFFGLCPEIRPVNLLF